MLDANDVAHYVVISCPSGLSSPAPAPVEFSHFLPWVGTGLRPDPAELSPSLSCNPLSFNIPRVTLDCPLNAAPIQKASELLK